MGAAVDLDRAGQWVGRWDAQQEWYMPEIGTLWQYGENRILCAVAPGASVPGSDSQPL